MTAESETVDHTVAKLCSQCKFWFIGPGHCENEKSSHYMHVILGKHPACGVFEPRSRSK